MKKLNVDIFSDIKFDGYQHVNQMLHTFLLGKGHKSRFLQKFYLNVPKFSRLMKVASQKYLANTDAKIREDKEYCEHDMVIDVKNIPSVNFISDILNFVLIKLSIRPAKGTAITFVPSKSLSKIFSKYNRLVYYCVHDSLQQSYHRRNFRYEKDLVRKSDVVFCDNFFVGERLAGYLNQDEIKSIHELSESELINEMVLGNKIFIVPAPVPNVFFQDNIKSYSFDYDYVYFGSIHKDIEIDCFQGLLDRGYKILIISNESIGINHSNVKYIKATSDLNKLISYMNSAKNILLPYKNSKFMDTVSPAKLYQCLATKKPIFTTNIKLAEQYGLNLVDSKGLIVKENELVISNVDAMMSDSLMKKVESVLNFINRNG